MAKTIQEKNIGNGLSLVTRQTTPPARFTEATLVKKLESTNTGRPSTYATIVETILSESRGYCNLVDKQIVPTERGIQLAQFLNRAFPNLINLNYTSEMEKELDKIADGKMTKLEFLTDFYNKLEESIKHNPEVKQVQANQQLNEVCPNCGKPLVARRSKFGSLFAACSGYPNCKFTKSLK